MVDGQSEWAYCLFPCLSLYPCVWASTSVRFCGLLPYNSLCLLLPNGAAFAACVAATALATASSQARKLRVISMAIWKYTLAAWLARSLQSVVSWVCARQFKKKLPVVEAAGYSCYRSSCYNCWCCSSSSLRLQLWLRRPLQGSLSGLVLSASLCKPGGGRRSRSWSCSRCCRSLAPQQRERLLALFSCSVSLGRPRRRCCCFWVSRCANWSRMPHLRNQLNWIIDFVLSVTSLCDARLDFGQLGRNRISLDK